MTLKLLKQLIIIAFGTAIMGFAIVNFSIRYYLADGGFSGINIIIYRLFDVPIWLSNMVLNAPFLFILYKISDLKTVLMTVYGVFTLTVAIAIFEIVGFLGPYLGDDMFLVIILYGAIVGIGIGLVIKANGTTGGSVLVAKILYEKWGAPVPRTLFLFDVAVITLSYFAFLSFINAIYTLIGIFIASVVVAKVQEGGLFGYQLLIISTHHEKISHAVRYELDRGATYLHAKGAHSNETKDVLLVVIDKKQLSWLKQIVHEIDPEAFMTVSHTYETIGEGFTFPASV